MNSHSDIRKLLPAYCGDDLPHQERAMVDIHLKECESCRAECADLMTVMRIMHSTPEVEPPPWMASRIMTHVREERHTRRSWLQRIFFPLHIKIPLELAGLLVVCITGYYLSQTVETEMIRQRTLQELPGATAVEEKTIRSDSVPLQPPPSPAAPVRQPSARMGSEMPVDKPQEPPSALAPPPSPVPESKAERSAPAAAGSSKEPALKSAPAADFSNRSREAAPGPKKKDATGIQRQEAESLAPAPAGPAAADSAGKYLPRISLQLVVADRAAASESIRTAASRSGALIVEDVHPADNRIRIRIAADRLPELMERLGRIGRLTDRPRQPSAAEEFEVTILW